MQDKLSHERVLIVIALFLCAVLLGYNAFFTPSLAAPTVVTVGTANSDTPLHEEYTPESVGTSSQLGKSVNINTATKEELMENLPGVGEVISQRIIDYRETHGGFKTIEELKEVKGIGDKSFEKMAPYARVS